MDISKGLKMLEIPANVMGKSSFIYPVLFWDDDNLILVDTGFPGLLTEFKEGIGKAGFAFEELNRIIITHHDIDHVGNLSNIINDVPKNVEVLAHSEEKPFIEGDKRALKLEQLEARLDILPEHMKPIYYGFKKFYDNFKVHVDTSLHDGEELPFSRGITVIHTPGHTTGHICLYHKQSKTLIAGDALGIENSKLKRTQPTSNFDNELALTSLKKLLQYDIDAVICYHGGLFKDNVKKSLSELCTLLPQG